MSKIIRTQEPTKEQRFSSGGSLVGSPSLTGSFNVVELTNPTKWISGTDLNEKTTPAVYLCGMRINVSASNLNLNASKTLRLMIVQNKNPADTLDVASFTDLYEGDNFAPKAIDAQIGDMNAFINTDILRVLCDKKVIVPPTAQSAKHIEFWCPFKRKIHFKTVVNSSLTTSGKIYLILQSTDFTVPVTSVLNFNWIGRLFYKPTN